MKESRKIQILQKMIDRLQLDNQELKNENKQLQEQIEAARNRYAEKQDLLDNTIMEYQKLIEENKKIREHNIREFNNLKQLKEKYNTKLNKIIRSITASK